MFEIPGVIVYPVLQVTQVPKSVQRTPFIGTAVRTRDFRHRHYFIVTALSPVVCSRGSCIVHPIVPSNTPTQGITAAAVVFGHPHPSAHPEDPEETSRRSGTMRWWRVVFCLSFLNGTILGGCAGIRADCRGRGGDRCSHLSGRCGHSRLDR